MPREKPEISTVKIDSKSALAFVFFQAAWFVAVVIGDAAWPLLLLGLIVIPLLTKSRQWLLYWLLLTAPLGCLFDGVMNQLNIIQLRGDYNHWWLPPWLILLWCHFAFMLDSTLSKLQQLPNWLLLLLAGVSGPLSYFGGAALGAAVIPHPLLFSVIYAIFWAGLLLLLVQVRRRFFPHTCAKST